MITVNFRGIHNHGPKQEAIARRACEALQQAVNHPDFAGRVAGASYRETRLRRADRSWTSVPPAEVYGYIASGAEMGTSGDATIDIEVHLRTMSSVGSTALGRLPFSTAFWFINECIEENDPISLASHFMHEWLHVAGFYHHPDNGARGDVPYVVQAIVADLLKQTAAPDPRAEHVTRAPVEARLLAAECRAHTDAAAEAALPEDAPGDPVQ